MSRAFIEEHWSSVS